MNITPLFNEYGSWESQAEELYGDGKISEPTWMAWKEYTDEYGNRACEYCRDIKNCVNCRECVRCGNCTDCLTCDSCRNGKNCEYCVRCVRCEDCVDCKKRKRCADCEHRKEREIAFLKGEIKRVESILNDFPEDMIFDRNGFEARLEELRKEQGATGTNHPFWNTDK